MSVDLLLPDTGFPYLILAAGSGDLALLSAAAPGVLDLTIRVPRSEARAFVTAAAPAVAASPVLQALRVEFSDATEPREYYPGSPKYLSYSWQCTPLLDALAARWPPQLQTVALPRCVVHSPCCCAPSR